MKSRPLIPRNLPVHIPKDGCEIFTCGIVKHGDFVKIAIGNSKNDCSTRNWEKALGLIGKNIADFSYMYIACRPIKQ